VVEAKKLASSMEHRGRGEPVVQPAAADREDFGGRTHMKKVLLVDQHNLFRQILGMVLEWHTNLKESVEANSLAETRRILGNSNHNPDLAIVACDLTNREGFKQIEVLRMTAPDVPVLAITVSRDVDRCDQALQAGADEVLTMASPPKEFVEVAKRLIGE
jgi:DNA-binding NarL/FixJ family response regulator